MAALEVLALNTTVPQIMAPQTGDTYTFPRVAEFLLGTAAAPSLTFTGDLNTGIYSPGADQVAISTGGTQRASVANDGFRIGADFEAGRLFIGNNAPSSDQSAILIHRGYLGSWPAGAHAVRDESTNLFSGTGFAGYASFDSIPAITGAAAWNHLRSFQARPNYSGSGTIDEVAGLTVQLTHAGSGTVVSSRGIRVSDSIKTGGGSITSHAAIWIDDLTGATSNFALYSIGANVSSYHAGFFQVGARLQTNTDLRINNAGFTTYGAILAHDTTGVLISNPNLTIINGVLDFKSNAGATIEASFSGQGIALKTGGSTRATLDAAGNLGLGVTPSLWGSGFKALQISTQSAFWSSGAGTFISSNVYNDGANKYITTAVASRAYQLNGAHVWETAPSGTAGTAITFTQAMTLDASGRLGIGTTTTNTARVTIDGSGVQFGATNFWAITRSEQGSSGSSVILGRDSSGQIGAIAGANELGLWTFGGGAWGERLRVKAGGQLRFVPRATAPGGEEDGDVYYNSATNKLQLRAGGAWVDLN